MSLQYGLILSAVFWILAGKKPQGVSLTAIPLGQTKKPFCIMLGVGLPGSGASCTPACNPFNEGLKNDPLLCFCHFLLNPFMKINKQQVSHCPEKSINSGDAEVLKKNAPVQQFKMAVSLLLQGLRSRVFPQKHGFIFFSWNLCVAPQRKVSV